MTDSAPSIHIRLNGHNQRVAAGTTLAGLAALLWEGAGFDVALFVVGETVLDDSVWSEWTLSEGTELSALQKPAAPPTV
jgi:hypothetical protein